MNLERYLDKYDRFTFFWGPESPFSQWHPATFFIEGFHFNCAEQYMMYKKALLFDDYEIAAKIMGSNSPRNQKKLGRQVNGFDLEVWKKASWRIVFRGNFAKFSQNPGMSSKLRETQGTLMVEANPYDYLWGIGIAQDEPAIQKPHKWPGQNRLGLILTDIRERLLGNDL